MTRSIITLMTDFGTDSPYVAQMKGSLLSIHRDVVLVDITHAIAPQNVAHGAITLGDVWRSFPAGSIHIAVVDPGVGTERAILCVRCGGHNLIAPDNGLLSEVVTDCPAEEIVELTQSRFWRTPVSPTFHGRDIMAPVAAHLSRGCSMADLGNPRDAIMLLDLPKPDIAAHHITGQIVAIDSFGNLLTNVRSSHLASVPVAQAKILCNQRQLNGMVTTYGQHSPGELISLLGSADRLELAIVNGHAARALQAQIGDAVTIAW